MPIAQLIIDAARLAHSKYGIPASVTIAQYGLESGWGGHMPQGSNNPFGIKAAHGEPCVAAITQEFIGGRYVSVIAAFRKFATIADAFAAHAELLTHIQYARARARLPDVVAFVNGLSGVYATDPHYGEKLLKIIEQDKLQQYDRQ